MACSFHLFMLAMLKGLSNPLSLAMDYYTLLSINNTEVSEW